MDTYFRHELYKLTVKPLVSEVGQFSYVIIALVFRVRHRTYAVYAMRLCSFIICIDGL